MGAHGREGGPASGEGPASRVRGRFERMQTIAVVLARNGLEGVALSLGLPIPVPSRVAHAADRRPPATLPQQIRATLEELGPAFMKLGQALATHPDMLPPEFASELSRLQDRAAPEPPVQIRAVLRAELGMPAERAFASFDEHPLACASIGQAHAAVLPDGTDVVVKVRRPGAAQQALADLDLLEELARRADQAIPQAHELGIVGFVADFSRSLRAELDYGREADNAERFAELFSDDPFVHIPRVHRELSTTRVLTLDHVRGIKVDDVAALDGAGIDRPRLAGRAADMVAQMVFRDRFFHADPHPGNMFVQPDGSLALIDFGMVGELTPRTSELLGSLVIAFVAGDVELVVDAVLALTRSAGSPDRVGLERDLGDILAAYEGRSLGEIDVPDAVERVLAVLRAHRLRLDGALGMLSRLVFMCDGIGRTLDPDFQLLDHLRPWATRLMLERLDPRRLAEKGARAAIDGVRLGTELPDALRRALKRYEADGLSVRVPVGDLDPLVARVERVGNRVVAGMIASALLQGIGHVVAGDSRMRGVARGLAVFGVGAGGMLSAYLALTAAHRRIDRR